MRSTSPRWTALALPLAVAFPASPLWGVAGVPFNTATSYLLLLVAVLFLGFIRRPSVIVPVLALLVIALKCTLLLSVPSGFVACYQLNDRISEPQCEKSFDYPLADFTRIDPVIDFGPLDATDIKASGWELPALNNSAFDYYGDGPPDRFRLPLRAQWSGTIAASQDVTLAYVGSGTVTVDGTPQELPASYEKPASVRVSAPAGSHLDIDYAWAQPQGSTTPYAGITVTDESGRPLAAEPSPAWTTAVTVLANVLLAVLILIAAAQLIRELVRSRASTAAAGVLTLLALVALARPQFPPVVPLLPLIAIAVLLAARLKAGSRAVWLAALWGLPLIGLALAAGLFGSIDQSVIYRGGGEDFLHYESHARDMLETGTLRGGEDVFVYSPAMRYIVFIGHAILGAGDVLVVAAGITGFLLGVWFAADRMLLSPVSRGAVLDTLTRTRPQLLRLALGVACVMLLALFVWSPEVVTGGFIGLSEYPTWIILMFALPLALTARTAAGVVTASALLGVDFALRANHLFGILVILALLVFHGVQHPPVRGRLNRWRVALMALGPFLVVALLPLVHNLAFAGRFQIVPASVGAGANNPLSLGSLAHLTTDPVVQTLFSGQIAGVFVIPGTFPPPGGSLSLPFLVSIRLIQAGLVLALALGAANLFRGAWRSSLLVVVPVAFLAPHLILVVYFYYPRHVDQGYLAGALVLVAMAGAHLAAAVRTGDPAPSTPQDLRSP